MKEKNTVPIYFFYGTQTEEIMRASDNAVREILGETSRDENLTIYTPPGNQKTVEFANILSELNADLATMSLVAENEKVAIVYNPAEVFSESGARARRPAKPKKGRTAKAESPNAGASDEPAIPPYLTWIEKRLPETGNHLIILAFEDEADGREVPKEHPILQIAGRMGLTAAFREKDKLIFKIEDSIRGRDALGCIAQIRELWKPGRSDMNIYTGVVRCIRFMLQAGIVRDRRE
ncbi:hypothetical protein HYR69_03325 [Candidatus Sumerlaeota bacterium]|nr:hypothetical protein [Candidatus Sumerlaeota bacterium]